MELKSFNSGGENTTGIGSNRTFMELKLPKQLQKFSSFDSSNRTFMELKFSRAPSPQGGGLVLIVPLWN